MPVISWTPQGAVGVGPDGGHIQLPPSTSLTLQGPVLPVGIWVPDPVKDALTKAGRPVPSLQQGLALIDTGASNTCIDRTVLEQGLNLKPHNTATTHGVSGADVRPVFACTLAFMRAMQHPPIFLANTLGVELAQQGFVALLGRDFLHDKVLIYNAVTGEVTLSW